MLAKAGPSLFVQEVRTSPHFGRSCKNVHSRGDLMTGKEMMMHAASRPPTFLKQCVSTINDHFHGRTRISLI
jgi:hypothetical protein